MEIKGIVKIKVNGQARKISKYDVVRMRNNRIEILIDGEVIDVSRKLVIK